MSTRFIIILLLVTNIHLSAQSLIKKRDFNDIYTKGFVIKEFSVIQVDTVAYFKFIINETRDNINKYVLESSVNKVDYVALEEKFKSPYEQALMYCYSINTNGLNSKFFRIRIETNENKNYSPVIMINTIPTHKKQLLTSEK